MKLSSLFVAVFLFAALVAKGGDELARQTTSFDSDWRFIKADPKDAQNPAFNDSLWRALDVPHDWSIEGPFSEKNNTGVAGAFLPAGVGWYRKHFTLPTDAAQRRVFVEFDGVMANSEIWINGASLGKRPNGSVSFRHELTGRLFFGEGKTNILAVRVDNSRQPASRYYTGAGIYRHTRLVITDPVHMVDWNPWVTTKTAPGQAVVRVQITATNSSAAPRQVFMQVGIFGPAGQIVQSADSKPQLIPPGKAIDLQQEITVLNPQLWDLERPRLYRAVVELRSGESVLDRDVATFGIREARFDSFTGFSLNGRNLKLKGVCLHSDGGAFGAAVPLRVWERRLEQLKIIGCNAIRVCHTAPDPGFLDLCDRMGFLVVDEFFDCWTIGKRSYDYHSAFKDWAKIDLRDAVCRDRNHPSVILYSIGNNVRDVSNPPNARKTLTLLRDICHQYDPTRPVTQALIRTAYSHDYANGFADLLDVIGQSYRENELLAAYKAKPTRKIVLLESGLDRKSWRTVQTNPACAGQFVWTGVDYLGDSPKWPWIATSSGLLDRTGMARPAAYERRALWTETPMAHIARRTGGGAPARGKASDADDADISLRPVYAADWSPRNTAPHKETVEVFSNCQEVELLLNGKSLGTKTRAENDGSRTWVVPFEPGVLKAIARNDGQILAGHELRTAGPAAALSLSVDSNPLTCAWDDVAFVKAVIVDKDGVPVPEAAPLVSFKIAGPGTIAAVDNASNSSHEPFQSSERRAFNGVCFAIVKATAETGQITLSASAPGLTGTSLTIDIASKANAQPTPAP